MIADRDLLEVVMEESFDSDSIDLRLISRHFEWTGGMRFSGIELTERSIPSERETTNIVLAAFGPLFRAYASMPFSSRITRPLLQATMDRLLPEMHRRLLQAGDYYMPHRRSRRILVQDPAPRITTRLQGDVAYRHLDRIEAAFEEAMRQGGGRVSLTEGTFAHDIEAGSFIPSSLFRRPRETVRVPHPTPDPLHEAWQHARAMEAAIMWGDGLRTVDRETLRRAKETLEHCLNEVQRAEFSRSGYFTVAAANGQLFTVKQSNVFNVEDSEWAYCAVPEGDLCVYDNMLASKLWLEADFERFMRVANRRHKATGRLYIGQREDRIPPRYIQPNYVRRGAYWL